MTDSIRADAEPELYPGPDTQEQAVDAQRRTVPRTRITIAVVALVLSTVPATLSAAPRAVVSGIVRDSQGVAQMGALIQLLANGSVTAASAVTDIRGRYVIANLAPGRYQIRATAPLLTPAVRDNVQLLPGARSVVNLTLSTLMDAAAWLPAERRTSDEAADDWKWTLRSNTNRPILKMQEDGNLVMISSSATENARSVSVAKASMVTGDNTLGGGGVHHVLTVDRSSIDGTDLVLRVDMGSPHPPLLIRPSTDLSLGFQRQMGLGGATRMVMSYQSHPEILTAGYNGGLNSTRLATAHKMQFGDMGTLEAGSEIAIAQMAGYTVATYPFLRLTMNPGANWRVGYRFATAPDLQGYDALDQVQPELVAPVVVDGHLRTAHGVHQELSVERRTGKGVVQVGLYQDNLQSVSLSGGGGLNSADLASTGVTTDAASGIFRALGPGYTSQGFHVTVSEPLGRGVWTALEFSNGAALEAEDASSMSLADAIGSLHVRTASTATVALRGRVARSGTSMRASYRWQPPKLVTAVDPYASFGDQAFLSFYLRQPIRIGSILPPGLEATVDVTNLLEEGYRPFLSADGRTLYFAQSPRAIEAGLAFNF